MTKMLHTLLFAALGLMSLAPLALAAGQDLTLRYDKPAADWDEALPLGNGRLGAMVFGGADAEHVQLNEDTLTSGFPGYRDLPLDVRKDYAAITGLIARRHFDEADSSRDAALAGRSLGLL